MTEASAPAPKKLSPASRRSRRWARIALIGIAALFLAVVALVAGARYGVQTGYGRASILRLLNGRELGPFGRLRIEGLRGDLLSDFSIARFSVVDRKGVWLQGRDVAVRWRWRELLSRRFHAQQITAANVTVLRRPDVEPRPPQPQKPLPVSIKLDDVRLRLETRPAFSVRPGLYDVQAHADIARTGAAEGRVAALSLLHKGDGLNAVFAYGGGRPTRVNADLVEAQGGALAGALGLPADRRLVAKAVAFGEPGGEARISLDTLSGDLHPLRATGGWGKLGGKLNAVLVLAASRLTQPYAEKLGPELKLAVTARHDRGDLYLVDLAADTRDAQVRASGPLDWRRQRTPGLKLSVVSTAPNKWLKQPQLASFQGTGTLSGDRDRFRWVGDVEARKLVQSGYSLARVTGPATLIRDRAEWRVQARLAGADGSGKGLTLALLGAAPHAQVDASRLGDGRLLIRDLKLDGAGLRLEASGGQGLLDGLSFKGQATLSNLAVARPTARGQVQASWTAGLPKGAKSWDFSFDAHASTFASGFAEADRLLGPAPRLTAKGAYGPGGLQLARAELIGAKAQVGAKGTLSPSQVLAMLIDYRADGPFAAGPVEIAGQVKGTGALTGTLSAPRADLKADFASIDFGRLVVAPAHLDLLLASNNGAFEGRASLAGPSQYGRASASTAFRFAGGGVELRDLVADAGGIKAQGSVALRQGAPSTADLTVAVGPGALLTAGRVSGTVKLREAPGGAIATLALEGSGVAAPELPTKLKTVRLTASGPLSRLPFQVAADSVDPFEWRVSGNGIFARTGDVNQLQLNASGRVRKTDFRTTEAALIRLGPNDRSARIRLNVAGGTAVVDARQAGPELAARATVAGVGLGAVQEDLVGKLNATLALNGRGAHLTGQLDARLQGARTRDAPAALALVANVRAALNDTRLHVEATATNPQGLQSALNLDLPAEASAQPFRIAINRTKPMRGGFSVDGELRPLWDLLAGGDQTVSGRLAARGTIAGTFNNPQVLGQATLAGGKVTDLTTGLNLQNLTVQASFDRGAVDVRQFSGVDGHGGTLSGQGRVALAAGGGSNLALKLNHFQLLDSGLGRATASGAVAITRDAKGLAKLSGDLVVDRADISPTAPTGANIVSIDVVEVHQKAREGEQISRPKPSAGPNLISLDVNIRAPRRIFIRGRGLDLELALDAHVGGSTSRPDLSGTARVVRGSYDFAGKRFDFDESGEVRLASTPEAIRLDLRAVRQDPTLTAVVRVSGTAARPEVSLTSQPVLPQDEILSQVLFGRSAAQLSAAEAAQLASGLASLSGGRGLDLIGGLRQFARLDRLAIGGDQTTGTTISGGKYITDNVYLELTGGGRNGPSAQVEYRVRPNLSIVSSVGTQGDTRLSVRFRKNFK